MKINLQKLTTTLVKKGKKLLHGETPMSQELPKFNELVTASKGGSKSTEPSLPSYEELQKMQRVVPAFEELVRQDRERKRQVKEASKQQQRQAQTGPRKERVRQEPRVKKAVPLPQFKTQKNLRPDMPMFYRHIRVPDPLNNMLPAPKGGVTLLFSIPEPDTLHVTFSVCAMEDSFVYDEGRFQCQQHYGANKRIVIKGYDRHMTAVDAIRESLMKSLSGDVLPPVPYLSERTNVPRELMRRLVKLIDKSQEIIIQ